MLTSGSVPFLGLLDLTHSLEVSVEDVACSLPKLVPVFDRTEADA